MEQRGNKTIICSVFFLDIVEYSKKSVSGQISLKERFNAFLSTAIRNVPVADRIILDTGDGAAISFLGDIEDALQAALSMRSSLLSEGVRMEPALLVRMGINLGPVRLVKDINGQPNIVGDGINVAQRVMGFADSGQILVSRSYFDAVSRLSQEYAGMFHYQGSRTDKHVREHEVYAIGYPGDFTSTQRSIVIQQQLETAQGWERLVAQTRNYWGEFVHHASIIERRGLETFRRASPQQRVLVLGFITVVLLSMVLGIYKLTQRASLLNDQSSATLLPLSRVVAVIPASAPVASSPQPSTAQPRSVPVASDHAGAKPISKTEGEKKVQGVKQSSRVRTLAETTGGPVVVSLAILPWGEVYLDGKLQGVSPPLLELQVVEGKHIMEIRNSTFPVYKQTVIAKPGEQIKIKYSFK